VANKAARIGLYKFGNGRAARGAAKLTRSVRNY